MLLFLLSFILFSVRAHVDLSPHQLSIVKSCCSESLQNIATCKLSMKEHTPLYPIYGSDFLDNLTRRRIATNCIQKKLYGEVPKPSFDDRHCCDQISIDVLKDRCGDIAMSVGIDSGEKLAKLEEEWNALVSHRKHHNFSQAYKVLRKCMGIIGCKEEIKTEIFVIPNELKSTHY